MIRPEYREKLESRQKILVALWLFFFAAVFLYLWLSTFLLADRKLPAESFFSEPARIVLWVLAFSALLARAWWKKRFLAIGAILVESSKSASSPGALQAGESPLEEKAARAVSTYVAKKIVAFALAEALAICGFGMAMIGHDLWGQYPLTIASGLLLLLDFPSRPFLEELLRTVELQAT